MKKKLTPVAVSLALLGLISVPAFAAEDANQVKLAELTKQVTALQQEVNQLENHRVKRKSSVTPKGKTCPAGKKVIVHTTANSDSYTSLTARQHAIVAGQAHANANLPNISGPYYLPQSGTQYMPIDLDVPGQSFVSTGPYIGVPLQYSGGDLIINNPSINDDVSLLYLRKNISKRFCELGIDPCTVHSHLLLSGIVEAQAIYKKGGRTPATSDIDLTSAGIDAYILGPTWISGLISLNYDNNIGADDGSLSTNARTQNSHVFVNKAFITIGDFMYSPWYASMGQMYVPFGLYSSSMISSPLTKLVFRTQARALLLGFVQQCPNSFYGSAYIFRGDSYAGSAPRINNGGFNLGYKWATDSFSGNFGGGMIANVADSQGMQNTGFGAVYVTPAPGNAVFGGFGGMAGTGNEKLSHTVPGIDLRNLFSIGKTWDLLIEYIAATRQFSSADMTMDNHGARPQALNAEAAYTFQGCEKPISVAVGYGLTKDALALGMPSQRYSLVFNTSQWRNTLQSLEFRHDVNSAATKSSTGSRVPGPPSSGKPDNVVTAQFDLYF